MAWGRPFRSQATEQQLSNLIQKLDPTLLSYQFAMFKLRIAALGLSTVLVASCSPACGRYEADARRLALPPLIDAAIEADVLQTMTTCISSDLARRGGPQRVENGLRYRR